MQSDSLQAIDFPFIFTINFYRQGWFIDLSGQQIIRGFSEAVWWEDWVYFDRGW
jgi:hypothetical protein